MESHFRVLVNCMTYNQYRYIQDALNGFAIQETNFPYICVVIDDASTDGEQDTILNYLNRECNMSESEYSEDDNARSYFATHKKNQHCCFAVYLLKRNLYKETQLKEKLYLEDKRKCIEYEAFCEGDDFWTDPLKLQKQVDFLDANPEYSMCCSDAFIETPTGVEDWSRYKNSQKVSPQDMIMGGGLYVQTVTLLFRTGILKEYPQCCKQCHVGDYPMKIFGSINGLYYITEKTSAYRFMSNGSWTSKNNVGGVDVWIPRWRSEVDMLIGLDTYSGNEYAEAFTQRIQEYLFVQLLNNRHDWPMISEAFSDVVSHFQGKKKIVNSLYMMKLGFVFEAWEKFRVRLRKK